jgi:hypothetical protein
MGRLSISDFLLGQCRERKTQNTKSSGGSDRWSEVWLIYRLFLAAHLLMPRIQVTDNARPGIISQHDAPSERSAVVGGVVFDVIQSSEADGRAKNEA